MAVNHTDGAAPAGWGRLRYHPVAPAVALLGIAGAGAVTAVATGGTPAAAFWWVLVGLVSGYSISGSV
jgi:hypothetical protein